MNQRQLEAFRATMREGSVTGAARALNVSQPSVSRLIADLESALGFELFLRIGRGVTATVEGRRFYRAVEGMFVGMDRLEELAGSIRDTAGEAVSIGATPALAASEVPKAVSGFHAQHPDVAVTISAGTTADIVDAVHMQRLDLGLIGGQSPDKGLDVLHEIAVPFLCLVPGDHPLAGRPAIDLDAAVRRHRFIMAAQGLDQLDPDLAGAIQKRATITIADLSLAPGNVRETGALALVDPYTAQTAVSLGGVTAVPLLEPVLFHVSLVTRGWDTLSREARALTVAVVERLENQPGNAAFL